MLIQFHLHQHADKFFGFMHIDAMFFGAFDNGLGDQAAAAGDNLGGGIAVAVGKGDSHLPLVIRRAHFG